MFRQRHNDNTGGRFADNHDLDKFYLNFENRFRGDESSIRDRSVFYAEFIKRVGIDFTRYPVLDIGCGRGEFLSLLREYSIPSVGIDINHDMVRESKRKGLRVSQSDAVTYMQKSGAGKLGVITGFQIIEHIPFEELVTIFAASQKALTKGGVAIFETPNPENIGVGSYSFYMDPSHLKPLPPPLIQYALESVGFEEVEIIYRNEANPKRKHYEDPMLEELSNRLYGPMDYAAVGYKSKRSVQQEKKSSNHTKRPIKK